MLNRSCLSVSEPEKASIEVRRRTPLSENPNNPNDEDLFNRLPHELLPENAHCLNTRSKSSSSQTSTCIFTFVEIPLELIIYEVDDTPTGSMCWVGNYNICEKEHKRRRRS